MKLRVFSNGFTLIEVLVALLILAIALLAITQALSVAISQTMAIKNKLSAHWVAMNVFSCLEVGCEQVPLPGEERHGEANFLGSQWEWTVQSGVFSSKHSYLRVRIWVKKHGGKRADATLLGFVPYSQHKMI